MADRPPKGEYRKPKLNAVEGKNPGKLTPEQEALADSNLSRAKRELGKLRLADSVGSELRKRELSLSERVAKLEKYMNVVATPLAGPMLTPTMARGLVREELLAHTAETQHNQAAYHATVNVAYVRAREVKVICEMFLELVEELSKSDSELAQKFRERLKNIERDYQRELNAAIREALETRALIDLPSLQEVKRRLTE